MRGILSVEDEGVYEAVRSSVLKVVTLFNAPLSSHELIIHTSWELLVYVLIMVVPRPPEYHAQVLVQYIRRPESPDGALRPYKIAP